MKFCSHAKWIMAGEHTVVRGGKALAFPLRNFSLSLDWSPANSSLKNLASGDANNLEICDMSPDLQKAFVNLLMSASDFCHIDFKKIIGKFRVQSDIPIKSGLGSSAAICTNLARLFESLGFCSSDKLQELATHLENLLHGKSSGLDIAVAISGRGVVFQHNKVQRFIDSFNSIGSVVFVSVNSGGCIFPASFHSDSLNRLNHSTFWPHIALSHSGKKSSTAECAALVQELIRKDPKKAVEMDSLMNEGANLCESGLLNRRFSDIKKGIEYCNEAFKGWGLYNSTLEAHAKSLVKSGALAVKPVGSGLGGFMLSLWDNLPSVTVTKTKER